MPVTSDPASPRNERARIYVYAAVSFLVLGFITTVVSVVIVNQFKNSLVEDAKDAFKESAERLAGEIASWLRNVPMTTIEDLGPDDRTHLSSVLRENPAGQNAVTAVVLTEDGRPMLMVDNTGAEMGVIAAKPPMPDEMPPGIDPDSPSLPPAMGNEEDITLEIPMDEDPRTPGLAITYRLSTQRLESELKSTAAVISRVSWILVAVLLLLLAAGVISLTRVLSHLLALHDETSRKDRLAYVGTLAAGLAHEIRNPLNAMNINLNMVADDLGTDSNIDASTRELVSGVKNEIGHLNKIVENFLAYARPTRRMGEATDLTRAVREAITAVKPEYDLRSVELIVGDLPEKALIEADPTALHQALTNILFNAAQAIDKPERHVTITGQITDHRVELTISDNGKGIPPEQLPQVFEVFYTTKAGGSGLGLPTAKRVVEDCGGTITVDSVAGQGTQVTISMPKARRRRRRG